MFFIRKEKCKIMWQKFQKKILNIDNTLSSNLKYNKGLSHKHNLVHYTISQRRFITYCEIGTFSAAKLLSKCSLHVMTSLCNKLENYYHSWIKSSSCWFLTAWSNEWAGDISLTCFIFSRPFFFFVLSVSYRNSIIFGLLCSFLKSLL